MQLKKQLIVIFFAYFLVINESEAIFGTVFKLFKFIPGIAKLFKKKKERSIMKRDLEDLFSPYQRNLEMDRLLKQLPNY
uniref:Non-disulfide-bridged peptide androcin 18-4 n=1 Tax=Androctonus bicolor TaxID=748906 RepID=A0A0K0LBT1_9SCOR|nr:Non-disulfide-bridged peptide androcin 18-4 [Androctonus bicolor]